MTAAMAATVNWEGLRELAGFHAEKGCALSVYLDLNPSVTATAGDLRTRVNSLLDEGAKSEFAARPNLSHDEAAGLRDDFDRVRSFLENDLDRDGARGVAVFCAGLDGLWRILPLPDPVPDRLRVGRDCHLTPLLAHVGRGDGALVAAVSRERGEVYRLRGGRLEPVADLSEDVPGQQQQGGWSQARYQRRVDNAALDHLREVADELDRRVRRNRDLCVVVVCPEEQRSELAGLLAQETLQAVAGWTQTEAHAGPPELLEAALPVLDQQRAQQEAELLERWREEAGREGRAASGWAATLEAASDARVEVLLAQDGVQRDAWRCPRCGRVAAASGSCPLDGAEMEEHPDAVDLAVHKTLEGGGTAWLVRDHHDLEPVEGIGALLRF